MHIQRDLLPDNDTIVHSMERSTDEVAVEPDQGLLSDVFGADSLEQESVSTTGVPNDQHPSDVSRLQAEHSTAGYREGITAAKATSVQAGFDEGFGLGAALGLRAGQITGILEGVVAALRTRQDPMLPKTAELLGRCRQALRPQSIFGAEFWSADGTWKYEVGSGGGGGDDVVFSDVVEAHPLIRTWSDILAAEMTRWGIDRSGVDGERGTLREMQPTNTAEGVADRGRSGLEW